ncbi:MAG TPA: ATP-binding protein, partial [Burkholderiales bacterium]|nr:ATP-binding protein [Burkholderiales bacterium]
EIATNSAMRVLLPIATLIPLSWLLIGLVVSRILKPLQLVTEAAARRELSNLEPLVVGNVPVEVAPLIHAMNALVYRLSQALSAQRQFLSDAAHELRTPLAALHLQIDNLPRSSSHAEFGSRVEEMQRGVSRAAHLVAQLLHIARYEAHTHAVVQSATDLNAVVKNMIADFIPLADCRQIDLGLIQNDPATIFANAGDIRILLGNLLDNAIRYTFTGGRVDIRIAVTNGNARVEIADTGPGISDALLPRVFDRFFRAAGQDTEGSGIGLSIVQAIAERESATVTLANRAGGHGLIATVLFSLNSAGAEKEMVSAGNQSNCH